MTKKENYPKKLNTLLETYVLQLISTFDLIPEERKKILTRMASDIISQLISNEQVKLIFICTHNSRRSHMSQIWTQAASHYYAIQGIMTYSGGTEATAFNPRAVSAMKRAGFEIKVLKEGANPVYAMGFAKDAPPIEAFSKKYDDEINPQKNFVAIMTCSEADQNCPFIPGASFRIPVPYDDPKEYDSTPQEEAKYDERCYQIAREMFFMMSKVQI